MALLVLLVLVVVLSIVLLTALARRDAYFTMIVQDTTKFISVGESLKSILANVTGFKLSTALDLDNRQWLIPAKSEADWFGAFFRDARVVWFQKLLWKRLGIRFFGFLWPQVHVHWFDIRSMRTVKDPPPTNPDAPPPVRSRIVEVHPDNTRVNELRFMVPRPVYLEGIDLGEDNAKINLVLLPIYRQVIPALPVYTLQGNFFTLLDAAIEAAVVDFAASHRVAVYKALGPDGNENPKAGQFAADSIDQVPADERDLCEESPLTFALWLKLTKAGEGSPMERRLRNLNVSRRYLEDLRVKPGAEELVEYIEKSLIQGELTPIATERLRELIPSGIVPRFGFALVSYRLVAWEPHPDTKPLADALREKETNLHAAEGVRQKAYGERDAALAAATGQRAKYNLVDALIEKGVDANVAATVLREQIRTENVRDSKLNTWVEGGSGVTPVVPISGSPTSST
ncbi:hypothetical protein KGO04_04510 [Patescibacteria group bacterium]|nr:hypothetical protein [Patescibacteria group bacterium]MDE1943938.1 hypothetical protein [Patescibacteria group bacterium]MDE1945485.1 hypothetical protein [Patescibacteria group bacterium]